MPMAMLQYPQESLREGSGRVDADLWVSCGKASRRQLAVRKAGSRSLPLATTAVRVSGHGSQIGIIIIAMAKRHPLSPPLLWLCTHV